MTDRRALEDFLFCSKLNTHYARWLFLIPIFTYKCLNKQQKQPQYLLLLLTMVARKHIAMI